MYMYDKKTFKSQEFQLKKTSLDYSEAISLGLIALVVVLLWPTVFVYPIKLLVVFFHEASHGAMAYATGGRVVRMALHADLSGYCVVAGGNAFLVASAGYLGSMLAGAFLLVAARKTAWTPYISQAFSVAMVFVAILFIRPLVSFGQLFAFISAGGFFMLGWKASPWMNRVLLQAIGIASCMKALLDMHAVTFLSPNMPSDATILAEITGIPAFVWGIFWLILGLITLWMLLPYLLRRPRSLYSAEDGVSTGSL